MASPRSANHCQSGFPRPCNCMSLAGITTLLVVPVDILLELVIVMNPTQILHVNFIPELQDLNFRQTQTHYLGCAHNFMFTGGKGTFR